MGWAGSLVVGFWIILLIVHAETGAYPGIWAATKWMAGLFLALIVVMSIIAKMKNPNKPK